MSILQSGSVAQDGPYGVVAGRRVSRLACVAILAAALLGSMLLMWASPQRAAANEFFEEKPGEEKPLPYGEGEGGPLLYLEPGGSGVQTSPKVHVIFWGSNFEKTETGEKVHAMLLKLYEGMTGSAYESILTQYFNSTGGSTGRVGSTVTTTSWIDKSVTAPAKVTEAKINEEIESAITTNKWTAELNAQFVLAIAPGATYEPSLAGDCAYHYTTPSGAIYDFIPYQGDEPFAKECLSLGNPSKNAIYKTSKSASHEFAEAATDPEGNTWGGDEHEIADLCVSVADFELPSGAYAQKQYDDHQNECSKEDSKPPHVYTLSAAASSVTSTNATLNGTINPEAVETHYYFEFGTTKSYGTRTSEVSAGSGKTNVSSKQIVCGLAASTTYDFHIVGTNSTGTSHGENKEFTTSTSGGSGCPSATTEAASNVKTMEATVNGTVNPDGLETKYHFEYGTTASYGKSTSEASAGSGTSGVKESQTTTGLSSGTEYHFRIVASNSTGTTYGVDKTFKTTNSKPPTVTTEAATSITSTGATLNGTVNPEGAETKYYFEYGETTSYGKKSAEASAGSGTSNVKESKAITGLAPGTPYDFRIVATNTNKETSYGANKEFTALAGWSFQEPPAPVGASGSNQGAVSCPSSTACISVGSFDSTGVTKPLAEKWNGTSWSSQEPPAPTGAIDSYPQSVSCSSSTECIAVGDFENSSFKYVPLGEKWNGTSWSVQEPPAPTGAKTSDLDGVSCPSSTECIAVGDFENSSGKYVPLAEKWNGTSWSVQEPPAPTGATFGTLFGVSCPSSTECFAVGYFGNSSGKQEPLAEKWNGTSWSVQEPPAPTGAEAIRLEGVSCLSSTECIAVGTFENSAENELPLGEKWNGTSWSAQEPPPLTGRSYSELQGVSCASSTACIAVGFSGDEYTLAEEWNGTSWSAQEPPPPTGSKTSRLYGVSCRSSTECIAVGLFENSSSEDVPLAEKYH